jgi:hypothetical protein
MLWTFTTPGEDSPLSKEAYVAPKHITRRNAAADRRRGVTPVAVAVSVAVAALAACSSQSSVSGSAMSAPNAVESSTSVVVAPATEQPAAEPPVTEPVSTQPLDAPLPPETPAPTLPPEAPVDVCGTDLAMPSEATAVSTQEGDFNGDGVLDQASAWAVLDDDGIPQWSVRFEPSGLVGSTLEIGDVGPGFVELTGVYDLDFSLGVDPGVNRDEVIAVVGAGASATLLGFFGVNEVGCGFQFDNGSDGYFVLPVGGSINNLAGLTCDGAAGSQFLVRTEAVSDDDGATFSTYEWKIERFGEQSLVLDDLFSGDATEATMDYPRYANATCGETLWIAEALGD